MIYFFGMRRFIAILLGLIVSACSSTAGPVTAQDPGPAAAPRTLDVSADATVARSPDRASIELAVETLGETAREAVRGNAEAMTEVLETLEGLGIPSSSIRTRSISLSPRYRRDMETEQQVITGYHATNRVSVRVDDVDRIGAVVDAAIAAGANRVQGIHFEIGDPEAAYHEALELAVAKARREAEVVARAMGATLGPAIRVSTGGFRLPMMEGPRMETMAMRAADPTPVEPGELEVNASVQITYRLDP